MARISDYMLKTIDARIDLKLKKLMSSRVTVTSGGGTAIQPSSGGVVTHGLGGAAHFPSIGADGELVVADSAASGGVRWVEFTGALIVVVKRIATGFVCDIPIPFDGRWTSWRVTGGGVSGDIVFDVLKSDWSGYPPSASIAGSDKPTLSAEDHAESTALTGWTMDFAAGDVLTVSIDSYATLDDATLSLQYTRT